MKEIVELLFKNQDLAYRDFQAPLFPNLDKETMIGVRTPTLKRLAKELFNTGTANSFVSSLPHRYFDENQLHAFLISLIKDYQTCLNEVNRFLPYVDNWGTCDQLNPRVFAKHKDELLKEIKKWLNSKDTYTIRFAIRMLMSFYLDEAFKNEYLDMVASIKSEEYYINMMVAWYFATALAKQYESAINYIKDNKLSTWVHNKTIQKAVESYRINDEQKSFLRKLKVPNKG